MENHSSYFDTLPLDVYSHIWSFLLEVDKPKEYLKNRDNNKHLNTILSFMLVHKRSKEAFVAANGWPLYAFILFLENKKLGWYYRGSGRRIPVALHSAVKHAVSVEDSTRLQASCDSAARKRKRDGHNGNVPAWVKPGVHVEDPFSLYGYQGTCQVVQVHAERDTVTIEYLDTAGNSRREVLLGNLTKKDLTRFYSHNDHVEGRRVQVICGEFEGLEGTVLCVLRSKFTFVTLMAAS